MKRMLFVVPVVLVAAGCHLFQKKDDPAASQPADNGAAAGGYDPMAYVKAPFTYPLGEGAAVGQFAEMTTSSSGTETKTWRAIVGDAGDSWQVETTEWSAGGKNVVGMLVKKDGFEVTKAFYGEPGGEQKDLEIAPKPEGGAASGEDVDLDLGELGAHPATMTVNEGTGYKSTTWLGRGGDLDMVLLRMDSEVQGKTTSYQLAAMPANEDVSVGGESFSARMFEYSNGNKNWITTDGTLAALHGGQCTLKMVTEQSTTAATSVASDATAKLTWE